MPSLFEAYVTNLGKYNEGELVGETLKFPATTEAVQALLKRIGVDGIRYEEIFITSFDGDVLGLYDYLGEYENLDELNHLAHLLSDIDYEAYGRDARINESGHYAPGGYVRNNYGNFIEVYHGREDIPDEHRIFAYPKLNIREQMAAYQEVIDRSALNEEKQRLPASREDR